MASQPEGGPNAPGEGASEPTDGAAERARITGRAGIVAGGTFASRLLGLGRDQVIAGMFGRAETDAFFIAFAIPNLLRQVLAEGAVQNAVLPVLSETRERAGEAEARRLFRAARGVSLALLAIVTVSGMLAAPFLVDLFAPGFRDHAGQYSRTVQLTRWLFPYIFFMGTAALGVAALNTYRRFVVTSFAPGLLNVAFIAAALILPAALAARGYDPVLALAGGALLGGALQVVAQWPSLRAIGFFSLPSFGLAHPGVREMLRRMAPVLFGIGVYYVDVIAGRRMLSELGVGAQSYFGWALRLCDFPQGIFVMALQTATLPSLAALVARGEKSEVAETFAYGMRLALFVAIGATAAFVALAEPLVVLVFQRGEFDALSARETSRALMAQGAGIWMVAAVRQLVAVFFALGDTRTPVIVSGLDFFVFLGTGLLLRGPLGHVGISVAVSAASLAQMILLWLILRRRFDTLHGGSVLRSALRSLVAGVAGGGAGWLSASSAASLVGTGTLARMVPGVAGGVVFAVVFLGVARLIRSDELETIIAAVRRRRTS